MKANVTFLLVMIDEILKEQTKNKITNIYGLLFCNYEDNTFITPKEINVWLRILNAKYEITDKVYIDVSEESAFKQLENAI